MGDLMVVPWGADLTMVEQALREISSEVEYAKSAGMGFKS